MPFRAPRSDPKPLTGKGKRTLTTKGLKAGQVGMHRLRSAPRRCAQVAQLVEQRIENPRVGSSILSLGTTKPADGFSLRPRLAPSAIFSKADKRPFTSKRTGSPSFR